MSDIQYSACSYDPSKPHGARTAVKDGNYQANVAQEILKDGHFVRQENIFVTPFGDGKDDLKAEPGRYKLYWAKGCHWSNRASIARELLGLENAIGAQIVSKDISNNAWKLTPQGEGADPETGVTYLYEFYENAKPGFEGRATVPTLVDLKTKKAVNNDYHHLTNYFEVNFRAFQPADAPDLYPENLRGEIDDLNWWLFPNINNGTYRMMFARSVTAYEEAYSDFFHGLDYLEERLSKQRFLFGDFVTDSDIRLYVTLVRFEACYYRFLGPLAKGLRGYTNLWDYTRDLYSVPAFRNNTYLKDLTHFYGVANPDEHTKGAFIPYNERFWDEIDYQKKWTAPQNRYLLSETPHEKFLRHAEK